MVRGVDTVRLASLIVVVVASVALALLVFMRNRRKPENRVFAVAVFTIVLWLILAFFCDQPDFAAWALVLNRLDLGCRDCHGRPSSSTSPLSSEKRTAPCPPGGGSSCFGGAVLALVTASTPLVVADVRVRELGHQYRAGGSMLWLMTAWTIAGVTAVLFVLVSQASLCHGTRAVSVQVHSARAGTLPGWLHGDRSHTPDDCRAPTSTRTSTTSHRSSSSDSPPTR